jgi:membrane associated rhomboid family serine protease
MPTDPNAPPLNPLPPVVWLLLLPVVAVEALLWAGAQGFVGGPRAVGWRLEAIRATAFAPQIFDWMLETARWPPEQLARFVLYPFVHFGFTHMLFVAVFLLALGKFVGEVLAGWAVAAVFLGSAIGGALGYWALAGDARPLVGGFPAVYGLIGAFTFILWTRLGQAGGNRWRAFLMIGFLMALQLVFGLIGGGGGRDWVADLSGFAAGFALSFLVGPGGWRRALAAVRRR